MKCAIQPLFKDVLSRILSFSLSGPRGVCVFSATGTVSNVAIRQPGSPSGATFSYEGRFEIRSLMGSYVANDSVGRSTTGGLSVSLAGADGRVIGGAVAGVLRAATLIQPRYVVNQVTAGNYDCPREVQKFMTDLYDAFRMLNLRNDFLRRKFDGMKYDLRRVTQVYYDVKIRGLLQNDGENDDQEIQK